MHRGNRGEKCLKTYKFTSFLDKSINNAYDDDEKILIRVCDSIIHKVPNLCYDHTQDVAMKYRSSKPVNNATRVMNMHRGQRKLFISELLCLSSILDIHDQSLVIVYAGAASGIHLTYLAECFPGAIWHLYDPAKFMYRQPSGPSRMHNYNVFFTDDVAAEWTDRCDLFISDIRLSSGEGPSEEEVVKDMENQERWSTIIRPRLGAYLKFRPPYIPGDVPVSMTHLRGTIFWQTWPAGSSTETRLLVNGKDCAEGNTDILDVVHYQDACARHNRVDRPFGNYQVLRGEGLENIRGFDSCCDCSQEVATWMKYRNIVRNDARVSIATYMNNLTRSINQPLYCDKFLHGKSKKPRAIDRVNHVVSGMRDEDFLKYGDYAK